MLTIPGKIPITIHPLFWLLALFIGYMSTFTWMGTLLAVVVIFYSVVFHELGHALTAQCFGQKTRIELAVFGGFTYREGRKLKLWEEFLVVMNGPFFGLLLFAIAFLLLHTLSVTNPSLLFILKFTSLVNLFWTVVNLIPVLPLDGGHLLSILLQAIFGFKGIRMAIFVGIGVGLGATVLFFAIGQFLAGAIFLLLTFESFRSLRYYKLLTEKDRETDLQEWIKAAEKDLLAGNEEAALATFEKVRERVREGLLYTTATEQIALILRRKKQYQEAFHLLLPLEKSLSQEAIPLFHDLCFKNRDYNRVLKLAKESYQLDPSYQTALHNAIAYSTKGQADPAVGWLECAIREGLPQVSSILKRPEFDSVRGSPQFTALSKNIAP